MVVAIICFVNEKKSGGLANSNEDHQLELPRAWKLSGK